MASGFTRSVSRPLIADPPLQCAWADCQMTCTAETLRRLAALKLTPEAMSEVLSIIADMQEADDQRKAKDRERKRAERKASKDNSRTIHGQSVDTSGTDEEKPSPLKRSPITPKNTPPSQSSLRSVTQRERETEIDDCLTELRSVYPKRDGGDPRKSARKALATALKGATRAEIVDGARRFAAIRETEDPKFTPMLATWLNRAGWQDEYEPRSKKSKPSLLARMATGEYWNDLNEQFDTIHASAEGSGGTDPGGKHSPELFPELAGKQAGARVLNFEREGSGWQDAGGFNRAAE